MENVTHTSKTTITFGDLLSLVGETIDPAKLPRAAKLRADQAEEVLIEGRNGSAEITVYKSGLVIYGQDKHETVTTVARCAALTYFLQTGTVKDDDVCGVAGCECHVVTLGGVSYLTSTVPLDEIIDLPWEMVIGFSCEPRLDHNQESREENHAEFSFYNDGNDWDPNQWVASAEDELFAEDEPDLTEREKMQLFLREDREHTILTDRQYEAIDLHYYKGLNQEKTAEVMGISQPGVNHHLEAAYKKLRKAYWKKK